ncbi:MAG TPA: M1 family metallopeptidase [Luteibaculaceae bacterium]|nr:M1 family metallopeptidase [Luteibaculaceae bacterium]
MNKRLLIGLLALPLASLAQHRGDSFKQLDELLPTPNNYRTASGAPGHQYWQQRADYVMNIELVDSTQEIKGSEVITYTNNSPDALDYLWLQLDQNIYDKNSDTYKSRQTSLDNKMAFSSIVNLEPWFDGGFKLDEVTDAGGKKLPYTVNKTMMRVDLPSSLKPGQSYSFKIKWHYNINDRMKLGGRSGYEYFEEDKNYLYTIAQFYPRMCAYMDYQGWQHKQFLGSGEFTLDFGNFDVSITVPSDHVVGATGELVNASAVLSGENLKRYNQARSAFDKPVIIFNEKEARDREPNRANTTKTWRFKAVNVRDFAFASSRKFIWDAMAVKIGNNTTMAMSLYPKEGNPLWEQYSTKVVAHTLKTYSKFTIDYPYPVAYSVHANDIGMEYPMICFNFGRPEKDGTYSAQLKYGMIGVIIHEVGHNFFPMIVNSDERQWTWMDEGLNTFVQFLTEQEFERNYPSRRGPAKRITDYMKGDKNGQNPIMTNSESVLQFGNNGYSKPATALNILRETVMGRELFDFAFKEYAQRWKFKHPTPADFFRTMEDASGVDLDWFWRSWFYSTDHVDVALKEVKWYELDTKNPQVDNAAKKKIADAEPEDITHLRNRTAVPQTAEERDPELVDFYTNYDNFKYNALDEQEYRQYFDKLNEKEKALLNSKKHYYQVKIENLTGMPTPVPVEFTFEDGTKERRELPAEIWRYDDKTFTKVFVLDRPAVSVALDPMLEIADVDTGNNYWPSQSQPSRFEMFKDRQRPAGGENPMQRQRKAQDISK